MNNWRTPTEVLDRARRVLGEIDLDPASDEEANRAVGAREFITWEMDGLKTAWWRGSPRTIWLNPPGGRLGNRSMAALWWEQLMQARDNGALKHAIFLAFNLEALRTTQRSGPGRSMLDFDLVVPQRRLRFVAPGGAPAATRPTHANAIAYVPGTVDRGYFFLKEFGDL